MEKIIALFVLLLEVSNVLTFNDTFCPYVENAESFDLSNLARGTWYLYGLYPNGFQSDNTGLIYKGRHVRGNIYKVTTVDLPETSPEYIEADISLDGNYKTTANLIVKLSHGYPRTTAILKSKIPIVDPNNYVVIYSCDYSPIQNFVNEVAWILVKSRNVEPNIKETIENSIKRSTVFNYDKFKWTNLKNVKRNRGSRKFQGI